MQFLLTREDGSVLLTLSRSKENSLSSLRRRLDIDEKNQHKKRLLENEELCCWEEPSSLHLSNGQIIYPLSVSTRLDFLCSQICHAVSFKWNTFRKSKVCHRLACAAPGTGHPWWCPHWERGMSAGVAASEQMQELGLKGQRWTCGETTYQWMALSHTPLLKPPSLPEKSCFLPAGPLRFTACMRRTRRLTEVVIARAFFGSPMLLLEECTVLYCSKRVHLWKWLDAPHTAARFPDDATPSRVATPYMFSYFGQKVQDKPRKLLFQASKVAFSLDKATMKV